MVKSRIWFTAAEKTELCERWKRGSSAAAISRALDRRNKTGVLRIVMLNGGIAPAPRRRALAALRLEEREEISRGIAAGQSLRQIALGLERAPSTVSREIWRNGGRQRYRANRAERSAWERALRPKPCRLAHHRELRWQVAWKLALQWSPEQISGWLKRQFSTDEDMQISHEAIYRSLFVQTRGVLKKELTVHLRTRRRMRLPKRHNVQSGQGQILDMVSIRERPAEAEDRAVPGHWEGDLLTGANDTHIAILIERHSRFTMLIKLPRKDTTTVVAALAKHVRKLPKGVATFADVGSRQGDACPQALYGRHQRAGLLLRPAQSLAARQQRKHQWLGAPVLAKRNKLLAPLPGLSQRDCLATQSTSAKDLGLRNPSR